jgi:hypothetical protein
MSHAYDETYDVYNESARRARKQHQCDACHETIRAGDLYHVISIVFDGDASSIKRCVRCQRIHLHLRELEPGEMWPNEKLACGEEYREHWGREPPEEIAALAFMTADEMQREAAS